MMGTSENAHYTSKALQPWDAMKVWMSREQYAGFLRGNVIKYLARYPEKDGVKDLRKERDYIDRLIELEAVK
jgi:hypothetical protein